MLYRIINPKVSLLVSLFSGTGFALLLAFAPMKNEKPGFSHAQTVDSEKFSIESGHVTALNSGSPLTDSGQDSEKSGGSDDLLKISPNLESKLEKYQDEFSINRAGSEMNYFSAFNPLQYNAPVNGETSLYYKNNAISIQSVVGSKTPFVEADKRNFANHQSISENQSSLRMLEMNYAVTPHVSALVKTVNSELAEDRTKERTTAFAGIGLKGTEMFSTQIVAGDTSASGVNNYVLQSQIPVTIPTTRQMERDPYGSGPRGKLLEWQTDVAPSQHLKVQAALFNSRKDNQMEINSPDGGRIAVFLNVKNLALNLRYNYLSSGNQRNQFNYQTTDFHGNDSAAVGLTIFLDKNKSYSFYVGGNYTNVTARSGSGGVFQQGIANPLLFPNSFNLNLGGLSQMNSPNSSSFSASFRGKPKASANTTFFVNFKNYYSRDTIYSSLGPFQIPILSQATFDYATSLGLELSF